MVKLNSPFLKFKLLELTIVHCGIRVGSLGFEPDLHPSFHLKS